MDASDEFKFVVVSGRSHNGHHHHKEVASTNSSRRGRSVENIPVVYNTNLKLNFLWNRAFKLFQSHSTVYKAVPGINFQDYGGGQDRELTCGRSGTSRSGGISLRAKSLSHSHLSGLEKIMEQPGTSHSQSGKGSAGRGGGSNRSTDTSSIIPVGQENTSGNNDNKSKTAYNHHQPLDMNVPVAMPRKRTVSRLGSSNNSRNNAINANANPLTPSSAKQRPVSISGVVVEPPQDRMDDNRISMGNNIRIPLSSILQRSHSARSRCSVDSLLSCHNHNECDNNQEIPFPALSSSSQFHSRVHKKLAKSHTQSVPIYSNSYFVSSSPCPDFGCGCSEPCEKGNCSDCLSEIVSNNLDSGLDTWKATTRSPSPHPRSSGMKPKLRDSSGIVCTISQRLPSDGGGEKNEEQETVEARSPTSIRFDDSLELCRKMNHHHSPVGNGNTTVVLINGCFEIESCQNFDQNQHQHDSLNLSDYDYMSEIDLNSEPGSDKVGEGDKCQRGGPIKNINPSNPSCENELDSLDLTLFESARKAGSSAIVYATRMTEACEQNDEPLYDTVCSSEDNNGDRSHLSTFGNSNYNSSSGGSGVYVNAWSDAGSEFEFMSPMNINGDLPSSNFYFTILF